VALHYSAESVTVSVQDDGRGIPPETGAPERGMGLASLRRRVERLGGRLLVETLEDGGAILRAVV